MRCSLCRRVDRAIFARLFPGRAYLLLCGVCLGSINAKIADELYNTSLAHTRHTEPASRRSDHFWSRLAGIFVVPTRKIEIVRGTARN